MYAVENYLPVLLLHALFALSLSKAEGLDGVRTNAHRQRRVMEMMRKIFRMLN